MNKTMQMIKGLLSLGVALIMVINTILPTTAASTTKASTTKASTSTIATNEVAISANNKIEAENFNNINIAAVENNTTPPNPYEDTEGTTQKLVNTKLGSYASYNNIDFGINTSVFIARYSAKGSDTSGTIEVWLDCNINNDFTLSGGNMVATLSTTATNSNNRYTYRTAYNDLITPVSGVHNVYLIFKPNNDKKYTCDLNWFYFSKELSSINVVSPTKDEYSIGETFRSYEDITIQSTYIDGTSGHEYIGREEIFGYDSKEQKVGEKVTVLIRNVTTEYTVNIYNELLKINNPTELTAIKNGTLKTEKGLGLPESVEISTITGIQVADVKWDMSQVDYNPDAKAKQNFTIKGNVILPQDTHNKYKIPLITTIKVEVSAAINFQFSFMSISDLHITKSSTLNSTEFHKNNVIKALMDANDYRCSMISAVGDNTELGLKEEYSNLKNIVKEYTQIPINYVMGNHDVKYKGSFQKAVENFNQGTGMGISVTQTYYDKWINGYHFIYMNTESDNKDSAYISDKQISWLQEKLKENSDLSKPIFIFLHQPISTTLPSNLLSDVSKSDEVQDRKILEVLGKYPQSIFINGHIHNELTVGGTLYNEKYCTSIRDGAAGAGVRNNSKKPEGLILDVYTDRVVVKGRDFAKKSTIWTTTIKNFSPTSLSLDKQPPTPPQNLTVTHKTDTNINLSWSDSTDNYKSQYYNVGLSGYDIYQNGKRIGSTSGSNNYKVTGLKANSKYEFYVQAKDVAKNISKSSSRIVVKTLACNDAPINLALNKKITASTVAKGHNTSMAVDGKINTKWVSTKAKGSEWIMVDLGENQEISRWVVKHAGIAGEALSKNAKTYELLGSTDKVNWTVLDSVYCNTSNMTDRSFDRTLTRYVKLSYETPSNYNEKESSLANLNELEVYGANLYKGCSKPSDINGLPYGTAKTAEGLSLPTKVLINTSNGKIAANVQWNIKKVNYKEKLTRTQTFQVKGIVILPKGVVNPDGFSLNTVNSVTVSGKKLSKLQLSTSKSNLNIGTTAQTTLKGVLSDSNEAFLSPVTIKYTSANSKIASVSSKGLIKAVGAGTTTIKVTVTINGKRVISNAIKIFVPSDDATLKMITIDNNKITGFSDKRLNYTVALSNKTKKAPHIKVLANHRKAKIILSTPSKLPGKATIKVIAEDGVTSKTYTINYSYDNVASIMLQTDKTRLIKGKSAQLQVIGKLKSGTLVDVSKGKFQFSISNRKVLSVDSHGKIRAKAKGTSKVTVKVTLNGRVIKSSTVTIKVS